MDDETAASTLLAVANAKLNLPPRKSLKRPPSEFIKGQPSPGFLPPQNSNSNIPWEIHVAPSQDGSRAQCLLCGRISSRNSWRLRAHFMGGDSHVQLCTEMTPEIEQYVKNNKKESTKEEEMPQEVISGYARTWNFMPLEGYRPCRPTLKSPWLSNVAFNNDGRAQCLLCGRISMRNIARLRAHFYGGDKHVAQCPSILDHSQILKSLSPNSSSSSSSSSSSTDICQPNSTPNKRQRKLEIKKQREQIKFAIENFMNSSPTSFYPGEVIQSPQFQDLIRELTGVSDWTYEKNQDISKSQH